LNNNAYPCLRTEDRDNWPKAMERISALKVKWTRRSGTGIMELEYQNSRTSFH